MRSVYERTPFHSPHKKTTMNSTPALRAAPHPFAELTAWHASYREDILEPVLPIVDPHHHAWLDQRGRYVFDELSADVNSGHNILATVFRSEEHTYELQSH